MFSTPLLLWIWTPKIAIQDPQCQRLGISRLSNGKDRDPIQDAHHHRLGRGRGLPLYLPGIQQCILTSVGCLVEPSSMDLCKCTVHLPKPSIPLPPVETASMKDAKLRSPQICSPQGLHLSLSCLEASCALPTSSSRCSEANWWCLGLSTQIDDFLVEDWLYGVWVFEQSALDMHCADDDRAAGNGRKWPRHSRQTSVSCPELCISKQMLDYTVAPYPTECLRRKTTM